MAGYQLDFTHLQNYDPGKPGIGLLVTLRSGTAEVTIEAKVDCGSTLLRLRAKLGRSVGIRY
jgi:hypothetical protein